MKAALILLALTSCASLSDCPEEWCHDQRGPNGVQAELPEVEDPEALE